MGEWIIEQKTKRRLLIAHATAMKKDPATSTGKHANHIKVHENKLRTAI